MMPGIFSQRKKLGLPQMDQTTMFNTPKSIFLAAIFDSSLSTDWSALPKKWFDPKSACKNLRLLSSFSEDDPLIASTNQGSKSELMIGRKQFD